MVYLLDSICCDCDFLTVHHYSGRAGSDYTCDKNQFELMNSEMSDLDQFKEHCIFFKEY